MRRPAFDGLTLEVDSATVYPDGDCFDGKGGSVVTEPEDGLVLFGAGPGAHQRPDPAGRQRCGRPPAPGPGRPAGLVRPLLDDLLGDDGVSLQTLLPRWVRPGLVLGVIVMLTVILWRARRFGALATEPMPVVVRAVETTRSLGRLYRRSGDRGHAAASLRRAAVARCAERLRLGSTAPADVVIREVARRTGRVRMTWRPCSARTATYRPPTGT